MRAPQEIIKRPLLTEKSTLLRETGGRQDADDLASDEICQQILFEVDKHANKIEIRKAVEELWDVKVVGVRTQVVRGKEKRLGRFVGRRPNWKKAIVTLKAGEAIDLFEE